MFFVSHDMSEKCSEIRPKMLGLCICVAKNTPQNSHQICCWIACKQRRKLTDELLQAWQPKETPEPLRNRGNGSFQRQNLWIFQPWSCWIFGFLCDLHSCPVLLAEKMIWESCIVSVWPKLSTTKLSQQKCGNFWAEVFYSYIHQKVWKKRLKSNGQLGLTMELLFAIHLWLGFERGLSVWSIFPACCGVNDLVANGHDLWSQCAYCLMIENWAEVREPRGRCGTRIVAQCSLTPALIVATPPSSATPFQRRLDVRQLWRSQRNTPLMISFVRFCLFRRTRNVVLSPNVPLKPGKWKIWI